MEGGVLSMKGGEAGRESDGGGSEVVSDVE